jgi:hypothetical protein
MKLNKMSLKNAFTGIGILLCFHVTGQNIGVNTYLPETDVHIVTQQKQKGGMLLEGSDSTKVVGLILQNNMDSGRRYTIQSIGGAADSLNGKFMIVDRTANKKRLVIDSAGNVGIGILDPLTPLHVKGAIKTDSTMVSKQLISNFLNISGTSVFGDYMVGESAFFTGNFSAITGDFVTGLSALSGDFTTDVSANTADFNELSSGSGDFSGDISATSISATNISLTDGIEADSGKFATIVLNDDFYAEDGTFTGYLNANSGIFGKEFIQIDSGYLTVSGEINTGGPIRYTNPQSYTHNVSALQFAAEGPLAAQHWIKKENFGYLHQAGPDTAILNAPLNLPDSAVIVQLTVHYYDSASGTGIILSDISVKSITKSGSPIPVVELSNTFISGGPLVSSNMREASIEPDEGILVENQSKMYYIQCAYRTYNNNANDQLRFYGVSIDYVVNGVKGI